MAFAFFRRWLGMSQRNCADVDVLVYSRAVCPLCDEAWELLQRLQRQYGFSLRTLNVDESAELAREHGKCVPVVTINGKVHFRGHVNEVLLRRILDAASNY